MTYSPRDSAGAIYFPAVAAPSLPADTTELEKLVICLFDEFSGRLSSYVLSFGLSFPDAEDIVQETFLSLFRHLQMGKPRHNLPGWLFRVAHNLALKRRSAKSTTESHGEYDKAAALQRDPRPSAEEQVVFSENQSHLLSVMKALPAQDRRCLALRAEGLKYREIARTLNMSLGAVSISLARSLARLSRASGENGHG